MSAVRAASIDGCRSVDRGRTERRFAASGARFDGMDPRRADSSIGHRVGASMMTGIRAGAPETIPG
jgi:hypothetical protein